MSAEAAIPDGVWVHNLRPEKDDAAALRQGYIDSDGRVGPHGTWLRLRYFVTHTRADGTLVIFDDNGSFAQFAPESPGSEDDPATWRVATGSLTFTSADSAMQVIRHPTLCPRKWSPDDPNRPANAPDDGMHVGGIIVESIQTGQARQTSHSEWSPDGPINVVVGPLSGAPTAASTPRGLTPLAGWNDQRISWYPGDTAPVLTWSTAEGSLELQFAPRQRGPKGPGFLSFSAAFNKAQAGQLAMPYYGFDPRHMHVLGDTSDTFAATGAAVTPTYPTSNPGQNFTGTLLFKFPAADSYDYVSVVDLHEAPNMPIGRRYEVIQTSTTSKHTTMLRTAADRVSSRSLSLGLSGGVSKMVSLGLTADFERKLEQQRSTESRYEVTREVTQNWADLIDPPSLEFEADFLAALQHATRKVLDGADPGWPAFVARFGTHYLHAVTMGSLAFTESRLSLQDELTSSQVSTKLGIKVSGKGEGGKGSGSGTSSQDESTKRSSGVSSEDTTSFTLGAGGDAAIFFDLRPLTELLCPVLVRHNPADAWGSLAPWVWTTVRSSLNTYLRSIGLDQPLDQSLLKDFTPQLVEVKLTSFDLAFDDRDTSNHLGTIADGQISLELPRSAAADQQVVVDATPPVQLTQEKFPHPPQPRSLSCIIAHRADTTPSFDLHLSLDLVSVDAPGGFLPRKLNGSLNVVQHFDLAAGGTAQLPRWEASSSGTDAYWYPTATVQVTARGSVDNPTPKDGP